MKVSSNNSHLVVSHYRKSSSAHSPLKCWLALLHSSENLADFRRPTIVPVLRGAILFCRTPEYLKACKILCCIAIFCANL